MVSLKLLVTCIVVTSVLELTLPTAALYTGHGGISVSHHGASYSPYAGASYGSHGAGYGYSHGYKKSKFIPAGAISKTDYLLKKLKEHGAAVLNHQKNQAKAIHKAKSALGKQYALQSLLHLTSTLGGHAAGLSGYGAAGLQHPYDLHQLAYGGDAGYLGPQYALYSQHAAGPYSANYAF